MLQSVVTDSDSLENLALERLKNELNDKQRSLKAEVIELINRDYTDFVVLATKLKGVDGVISELHDPISRVQNHVEEVTTSILDEIESLQTKLQRRCVVRDKKAYLQLFLSTHNSVRKLENLIQSSDESSNVDSLQAIEISSNSEPRILSDIKLVERIAIEYNHLQFLVRKGKGLKFMEGIQWRIDWIQSSLQESLRSIFRKSCAIWLDNLHSGNTSGNSIIQVSAATRSAANVIAHCLRIFSIISQLSDAIKLFDEEIVLPGLMKIFKRSTSNSSSPSSSPSHATTSLSGRYSSVSNFLSSAPLLFIDLARDVLKEDDINRFVADCIFTDFVNMMIASPEINNWIASGVPDVFHKNYRLTTAFISYFETNFCQSVESLQYLRTRSSYSDFIRRWSVDVYFSIRLNDVVSKYEKTLKTVFADSVVKGSEEAPKYIQSKTLLNCILFCWRDDVFLEVLAGKFWKLTLQLIARYVTWLSDNVKEAKIGNAGAGKIPANSPPNIPRQGSPSPQSSATSATNLRSSEENENLPISHIFHAFSDVQYLQRGIRKIYSEIIRSKLPDSLKNNQAISDSLSSILSRLTLPFPILSSQLIAILTARCTDPLKFVRNITAQYRRTNKEAPTECSFYVELIFKPIWTVHEELGKVVDQENWNHWINDVVKGVATSYTTLLTDLLTTLKKTEDSLKRLKKSNTATSPRESNDTLSTESTINYKNLSDEDKIRLQCYLDVEGFGQEIRKLGFLDTLQIDLAGYTPYQELWDVVKEFGVFKYDARKV
ncbi:hypothetical protein BKA69DRAFT_1072027 [Paraphysoderma sedebokerense]|nr:hypothetical protein BKA69DRAFT_1072027 [Paraphysoderma sedebokerense]